MACSNTLQCLKMVSHFSSHNNAQVDLTKGRVNLGLKATYFESK